MKKWCWKKKMWEKCGVQNQKIGVWAWCLIIPFVVLKTAKFGVKILGGGGCQKPTNQSQHMGSQCSGGTKLQPPLSTAMFYCYNLNYNILTVYNKEPPLWEHSRNPFALAQHGHILPGSRRCCETVKLSSETAGLSEA